MYIIFIFLALILGSLITFIICNNKQKALENNIALLKKEVEWEKINSKKLDELLINKEKECSDLNQNLKQTTIELEKTHTQLNAQKEYNSKETSLRNEQFQEQLKTIQQQFSNLATKILSQASDKLKTDNNSSIENLTKPIKENIEQLQKAINNTNAETARNTASLEQQLKAMHEQTLKIDKTATQLTNVIKGDNKQLGNWGERTLTNLLESQGFRCGIDYDIQETIKDKKGNVILNDDSGKKMIPDVILHYPNNEDIIIDSKMTIEAYYMYVNAENDEEKNKQADNLVTNIRRQANGLAKKDYSKYIKRPRKAIDFVIMFVPNEGALQLALAKAPELWNEVFQKKVFITGQQNLFAILKMIEIAWRQYNQSENEKKVFDLAEELLKRVGDFITRFEKVGKDIKTLQKDYVDAHNKAWSGRQSIAQKANELINIGVKKAVNLPNLEPEPEIIKAIEINNDKEE